MSYDDLLYPSRPDWPGGQRQWGHGVVLHDQGEGYQPPILDFYFQMSVNFSVHLYYG